MAEDDELFDGLTALGCSVNHAEGAIFVVLPDEFAEFVFDRQGDWLYLGTTFLTPEELEASADLGGQIDQDRPQRFVHPAGAELLAFGIEVEQLLFVLGGDGGGAVVELDLFGTVEIQSEGALDKRVFRDPEGVLDPAERRASPHEPK